MQSVSCWDANCGSKDSLCNIGCCLGFFRPEDYTILEVAPADEEMAAVSIQNNNWF